MKRGETICQSLEGQIWAPFFVIRARVPSPSAPGRSMLAAMVTDPS
jgi:hypothetical protein